MKCPYCGRNLPQFDDYRRREHIKICKYATPMERYIASGIEQKEYPVENHRSIGEQHEVSY